MIFDTLSATPIVIKLTRAKIEFQRTSCSQQALHPFDILSRCLWSAVVISKFQIFNFECFRCIGVTLSHPILSTFCIILYRKKSDCCLRCLWNHNRFIFSSSTKLDSICFATKTLIIIIMSYMRMPSLGSHCWLVEACCEVVVCVWQHVYETKEVQDRSKTHPESKLK